jgi:hypothetical protein
MRTGPRFLLLASLYVGSCDRKGGPNLRLYMELSDCFLPGPTHLSSYRVFVSHHLEPFPRERRVPACFSTSRPPWPRGSTSSILSDIASTTRKRGGLTRNEVTVPAPFRCEGAEPAGQSIEVRSERPRVDAARMKQDKRVARAVLVVPRVHAV